MAAEFHFAFPDGVLDYACASCTALCCRGQGFSANVERELVPLLKRHPKLAAWTFGHDGSQTLFASASGRCSFLGDDKLCDVERELGRSAKPTVCRTFPFNGFQRVGDTLVVSPHLLCPLQLRSPSANAQVAGDHARLAIELRATNIQADSAKPATLPPGESPEQWLQHEAELRELCARELWTSSLPTVCRSLDGEDDTIEVQIAGLLEIGPDDMRVDFDPFLMALGPSLSASCAHLPLRTRRRMLRLAHLVLGYALGLGNTQPSLQVCHGLWVAHRPLFEMLARADEPMPEKLLPASDNPALMLAAAVADAAACGGSSVYEALEQACEGLPLIDRYAFIHALAGLDAKRANSAS